MSFSFEKTNLWKRTLAPQKKDEHQSEREKLRQAFLSTRDKVKLLTSTIIKDCDGLTIHDDSHLDALWEMADLICGPKFLINPVEAFVFGCAILLHDSAMAIAAYPDKVDDIKKTIEWSDISISTGKKHGHSKEDSLAGNLPPELLSDVMFKVLRALHATKAEELLELSYKYSDGCGAFYLLDKDDLRQTYGKSIGRIASSHHWNSADLSKKLSQSLGVATDLPAEWIVNEVKVAALLRCADAAHVDDRRAPPVLFSFLSPKGVSKDHWLFQSLLTKPAKKGGTLIYSSKRPFRPDEASAWWLCYETIGWLNKEITDCNNILSEIEVPTFEIERVAGVNSPDSLAKHVQTLDWKPVNAEVKVTDPAHLASTLGGANLYGRNPIATIRELIQNSADAIRFLRKRKDRPETFGQIGVKIGISPSHPKSIILSVEDNGLGMPETIMTGTLIDFGKSLWQSNQLHNYYPGAEQIDFDSVGKFGIGFFSVFMLGGNVSVTSKPYNAGDSDYKTLEFSSLGNRPILKPGGNSAIEFDVNTIVSVTFDIEKFTNNKQEEFFEQSNFSYDMEQIAQNLYHETISLISPLNINVKIENSISGDTYNHSYDWTNVDGNIFLSELLSNVANRDEIINNCAHLLTELTDGTNSYGRAALSPNSDRMRKRHSYVDVGGFVYSTSGTFNYIGVTHGDTRDISRRVAIGNVPKAVVASWASAQALKLNTDHFQITDLMNYAHDILNLGGNPQNLPFCLIAGKVKSYNEFREFIRNNNTFHIMIKHSYSDKFEIINLNDILGAYIINSTIENFVCVHLDKTDFEIDKKEIFSNTETNLNNESLKTILKDNKWNIVETIENEWGSSCVGTIKKTPIFTSKYHSESYWRSDTPLTIEIKRTASVS